MALSVRPLTRNNWKDLEQLFGCRGGSIPRFCWCMAYRQSGKQSLPPGMKPAEANKRALRALVDQGQTPGLVGYEGDKPIGWISLGRREEYARLQRSPVMKPLDDRPAWSIVCFFVDPAHRGQGVAEALLEAAVRYARLRGAKLLEAYPVDKAERSHSEFMWFGARQMFDRAGFREVARRTPTRPLMRRELRSKLAREQSKEVRHPSSARRRARPKAR